jgi:hypothetical protein
MSANQLAMMLFVGWGVLACKPLPPSAVQNDPSEYKHPVQLPMPISEKGHIHLVPPLFLPESLGQVVPEETEFIVEVLYLSERMLHSLLVDKRLDRFVTFNHYTTAVRLHPSTLTLYDTFRLSHRIHIQTSNQTSLILATSYDHLGNTSIRSASLLVHNTILGYNSAFPELAIERQEIYYPLFIASFQHPSNASLRYYFALNRHNILDFAFRAPT